MTQKDAINPGHYTGHPSGVECIRITEHMNFCRGNAVKYIWRAGEKDDEVQDLKKARWYIDREIQRLEGEAAGPVVSGLTGRDALGVPWTIRANRVHPVVLDPTPGAC